MLHDPGCRGAKEQALNAGMTHLGHHQQAIRRCFLHQFLGGTTPNDLDARPRNTRNELLKLLPGVGFHGCEPFRIRQGDLGLREHRRRWLKHMHGQQRHIQPSRPSRSLFQRKPRGI